MGAAGATLVNVTPGETVFYTSTEVSPLERHLYRAPFSTREGAPARPERVTEGSGTHKINLSADRRYYLDTFSDVDSPPVTSLHRADGTPRCLGYARFVTRLGDDDFRQWFEQLIADIEAAMVDDGPAQVRLGEVRDATQRLLDHLDPRRVRVPR